MGLWRNDPETPEGKYPIVLRRDGTVLTSRNIVLVLKDPCVALALEAYANELFRLSGVNECQNYGWSVDDARVFARDMFALADESRRLALNTPSDPGAPRHRTDDPVTLAWARSLGCPGS